MACFRENKQHLLSKNNLILNMKIFMLMLPMGSLGTSCTGSQAGSQCAQLYVENTAKTTLCVSASGAVTTIPNVCNIGETQAACANRIGAQACNVTLTTPAGKLLCVVSSGGSVLFSSMCNTGTSASQPPPAAPMVHPAPASPSFSPPMTQLPIPPPPPTPSPQSVLRQVSACHSYSIVNGQIIVALDKETGTNYTLIANPFAAPENWTCARPQTLASNFIEGCAWNTGCGAYLGGGQRCCVQQPCSGAPGRCAYSVQAASVIISPTQPGFGNASIVFQCSVERSSLLGVGANLDCGAGNCADSGTYMNFTISNGLGQSYNAAWIGNNQGTSDGQYTTIANTSTSSTTITNFCSFYNMTTTMYGTTAVTVNTGRDNTAASYRGALSCYSPSEETQACINGQSNT